MENWKIRCLCGQILIVAEGETIECQECGRVYDDNGDEIEQTF